MNRAILIITLFLLPSFANASTYTIKLETTLGTHIYTLEAPEDYFALDSVLISGIYNKNIGKVKNVQVLETGLSTEDIPPETFIVRVGGKKERQYMLTLNVINIDYTMTAIQATKYFLSHSDVIEITHNSNPLTLQRMPQDIYKVIDPLGREGVFKLNSLDKENAQLALNLAAILAKGQSKFEKIRHPQFVCSRMFR